MPISKSLDQNEKYRAQVVVCAMTAVLDKHPRTNATNNHLGAKFKVE